jgi:hypothetical protein
VPRGVISSSCIGFRHTRRVLFRGFCLTLSSRASEAGSFATRDLSSLLRRAFRLSPG